VLARWNSTEVYSRINGQWKIIHSHWLYTMPQLKGGGSGNSPHLPAISAEHAAFARHPLVRRRRRGVTTKGGEFERPTAPNPLGHAAHQVELVLGDRRHCYPATIAS
jgi:hypothetical protein